MTFKIKYFATAIFLCGLIIPNAQAQSIQTKAKQAIVKDFETGAVLFEKNADERMATSSMSKVITMYEIFKNLENGNLTLDQTLPVSEKAWRKGGSKMFVEVGKQVKVEDLIRGVIVQSGNDATIVLAEGVAGTEDSFAAKLTETAQEIGMNNSQFKNASGWPDPEHYSTARDLSILGERIISDFPKYYPYYSETEFTFNKIRQTNRNPLLYRNIGADGIKTGHTEAGGYGLMGSGVKDGRRVVIVINGLESSKERAEEGTKLLDWGLSRFQNVSLFKAGETVDKVPVELGKTTHVPVQINEDIKITLQKTLKNDLDVQIEYQQPLHAPIKAGDVIGSVIINAPRLEPVKMPLYAASNVERLGLFAETLAKTKKMLLKN